VGSFPGGKQEAGEAITATIGRELPEELGDPVLEVRRKLNPPWSTFYSHKSAASSTSIPLAAGAPVDPRRWPGQQVALGGSRSRLATFPSPRQQPDHAGPLGSWAESKRYLKGSK